MVQPSFQLRLSRMFVLAGLVLVWLLAVKLLAAAQDSSSRQHLVRADVVLLDVSVLDRSRQPVRGLTAAEFTVLEDGKPHAVEYFTQDRARLRAAIDVFESAGYVPEPKGLPGDRRAARFEIR